jgi:methyl-accepting chemotaxis protein
LNLLPKLVPAGATALVIALAPGIYAAVSQPSGSIPIVTVACAGAAVVIAAFTAYNCDRSASALVAEARKASERLAEGNLQSETPFLEREHELGGLMRAVEQQRKYLIGLSEAAREASAGNLTAAAQPRSDSDMLSKNVAGLIQALRKSADDRKALLTKTSSVSSNTLTQLRRALDETTHLAQQIRGLTDTVEKLREGARQAESTAKSVLVTAAGATQVSKAGQDLTEMLVVDMVKACQQMQVIAESVVQLNEQSQTISHIVTSVNEISAQSNLLAVNASIEAAKAGEHGKGFSVVAQEVKVLADESKQATLQIRAILGDIEKATAATVMVAEQGTKAVTAGTTQSKSVGESIRALGLRVTEAAEASEKIAEVASRQLQATENSASELSQAQLRCQHLTQSLTEIEKANQDLISTSGKA